jgi:hypothetical protein
MHCFPCHPTCSPLKMYWTCDECFKSSTLQRCLLFELEFWLQVSVYTRDWSCQVLSTMVTSSLYMFWILSKTMSKQLDNANRPTKPSPCVGMLLCAICHSSPSGNWFQKYYQKGTWLDLRSVLTSHSRSESGQWSSQGSKSYLEAGATWACM